MSILSEFWKKRKIKDRIAKELKELLDKNHDIIVVFFVNHGIQAQKAESLATAFQKFIAEKIIDKVL